MEAARIIAHQHHEKWNGDGYPQGLKGEDIHIFGRIVAIVDVFDALICKRSYKDAWPPTKVLQSIEKESGQHFDPELVELVKEHFNELLHIHTSYPDV